MHNLLHHHIITHVVIPLVISTAVAVAIASQDQRGKHPQAVEMKIGKLPQRTIK